MKITIWNCQGAYRKKAVYIAPTLPDILIVPECEHLQKLTYDEGVPLPIQSQWIGDSMDKKGLGVFSYTNVKFQILPAHTTLFRFVVPMIATQKSTKYLLLAVWANNPSDKEGAYITQVWKAIHHYEALFSHKKVIIAGDFNSNTIWDKSRRIGNHSAVVQHLATRQIHSSYHHYYKQAQGQESHPTFYMYRHQDKPYHMDYCFLSNPLLKKISSVAIGSYQDWRVYSDHVPLEVNLK